jgi:tetratricopeptide (TPR) repeat protein
MMPKVRQIVALAMPDDLELLEDGIRAERSGLLDRALLAYRTVASMSSDHDTVARALTHEADVHRARCQWEDSLRAARRAQEVAREARLPTRIADALVAEINVFITQGDFGTATLILNKVIATSQDPRIRGIALQNLGIILAETGELREAERAFHESVADFREAGYVRGEAIALNNFGELALKHGAYERAELLLEDAVTLGREIQDLEVTAMASLNLASALCHKGELDRAQDLAMAALGYFSGCRNAWREIECLRLIGDINEKGDDCRNAARCYDRAVGLAKEIGAEVEERVVRAKLTALQARLDRGQDGHGAVVS